MKMTETLNYSGPELPYYLRRSTYVHIAIFLLTIGGGKIVLDQQAKLRDANIELIEASVKVDMVAMPKYTLNEMKNLSRGVEDAKKEEPTPEAVVEKKIEEEKPIEKPIEKIADKTPDPTPSFEEANKKKRESFLSKLKQISNKKIKSEGTQKADKGLYGEKATDLKQLVLAGNKLNKGTAMYGDGNASDMTAFQLYASRLPDLVRPHWRLPSFLLEKKLKCRIRVWLALNGEVSRAEVYQSSGDSEYDQRAIDAVKSTSPFPKLTEDFGKRGLNGDILLGFPL